MKVRDSGMPDEEMWDAFSSVEKVLALLGPDADIPELAEFGCGYGTFTLAAARLARGTVYAFDIKPHHDACVSANPQKTSCRKSDPNASPGKA